MIACHAMRGLSYCHEPITLAMSDTPLRFCACKKRTIVGIVKFHFFRVQIAIISSYTTFNDALVLDVSMAFRCCDSKNVLKKTRIGKTTNSFDPPNKICD